VGVGFGFVDGFGLMAVDVGTVDIGAADVGAADVGAADVGAADVGAADVGAAVDGDPDGVAGIVDTGSVGPACATALLWFLCADTTTRVTTKAATNTTTTERLTQVVRRLAHPLIPTPPDLALPARPFIPQPVRRAPPIYSAQRSMFL
jgi:hypothetical protein